MSESFEEMPHRGALDIVRIDGEDSNDTYVLYPLDATDSELETKWIRSKSHLFASLWEWR